jgi:hypothetical protein
MAKFGLKTKSMYALLFLCVLLALLPFLHMNFSKYLPRVDGFRDLSCVGVSCPENQFCYANKCVNKYPTPTLPVPEGNE